MHVRSLAILLSVVVPVMLPDSASAAYEAILSASQKSARAESMIASCGRQFRGQQVVNCVSTAVVSFAADVGSCGYIGGVAPRAAPALASVANQISAATTKHAAISVLNRVRSVLNGLAAQSSGEARSVYTRINRALDAAISVINSKG